MPVNAMRLTEGVVMAVDNGFATVEFQIREGGCGRCHEAGGCGSANLSRMGCSRARQATISNALGAAVGQRVVIGVEARAVSRFATAAYLRPLIAFLLGAGLGQTLGDSAGAALGGFSGLALAFWWLKRWPSHQALRMVSLVR